MKSCRFFSCAFGLIFLWIFSSSLQSQTSAPQWSETPGQSAYIDPTAGCWRGNLEGYTDKASVTQGQAIAFKVSVWKGDTDITPGAYKVRIYRVGRNTTSDSLVYTLTDSVTSSFQALHDSLGNPIYPWTSCGANGPFPMEYRNGCNWPTAFTITVGSNWRSGFYYAQLARGSYIGRIPFVVKEDNPGTTSKILCVIAWNTFQAYNYWGGGSLYWWTGFFDSPDRYASGLKVIRTVSFQRPFGLHYHWDDSNNPCGTAGRYQFVNQLGQFDHRERQFINWAESNGYNMEFAIDFDVHDQGPTLLNNYKLVVFPGHSEYWSVNQRVNIRNFRNAGGNLAFFAANNCYWRVDFQASNTKIFCNKENNLYWWRNDPVEGPESNLIGIQFGGVNTHCDGSGLQGPNFITQASHWLFSGTGLTNGAVLGQGQYHDCPSQNIDPLAAGEADMKAVYDPPNANVEILARRKIRDLFAGDGNCPADVHFGDSTLLSNELYSDVTYYEDQQGNARVFASGAHGWCNALYGSDGTTMGIITRNLLDHFSYKKYRGNIYANLIWGDEAPVENATILDGDTYILPNKTLSLTNNFLLTINSGVTLYVQGTLVIGSGVTITGGGKIVTSGGGTIKTESTTSLATSFNNSRKIARDASGNYHIVFDAGGEICYEKWTNNGTELREFKRLSGSNGNNAYACIAERGGRLYVVWQRKDGTTYDVHFRKSTNGGTTWNTSTELFSNISQSTMLPVITSAATNKLMVVCRGGSGSTLRFRTSDDDGANWAAGAAVPSSNSSDGFPTLAPTTSNSGGAREALAYSRTSPATIYYRYYMHGPDSTGWNAAVRNLLDNVPGTYTNHRQPSLAPSGTSTNKQLHVAWEAVGPGSVRVIIHRKATNWYT